MHIATKLLIASIVGTSLRDVAAVLTNHTIVIDTSRSDVPTIANDRVIMPKSMHSN